MLQENHDMLYPKLFADLERSRWDLLTDINWEAFDSSKLSDEQALTIKMNAITEWSALPATEMFLRDNKHDSDFCAFISVWFFEEQKHSLVMLEYLRRFRPDLLPTMQELEAVRFDFDPAPPLETLMLHFCGEMRLTQWYKAAANWHTEPVIKQIYSTISADEAKHGNAYLQYMRRAIIKYGNTAKLSFAKIGFLMATSCKKGRKPLHPTNLHVNKSLAPNDTVQSKMPDPGWLENWIANQIKFDLENERQVIRTILNNLSKLCDRQLTTVEELSDYRKELMASVTAS